MKSLVSLCEEIVEETHHTTQMAKLRGIYRNPARRELALLFIDNAPAAERAMLMAEFEHLEMMHDSEGA